MRSPFVRKRLRGASLSTVVPSTMSRDYSPELASIAARIIYQSPLNSADDLPVYILNSAEFPDAVEVSYDRLLPYVMARLPGEDELLGGKGYEVIFFAGGSEERGDPSKKKNRPSISWIVQAYNVLGRAMRKRLAKLYLVHERKWVRLVTEVFSTIVSPKFRRKVVHASTLSQLALHVPIQDLLIPPSAYVTDRKLESQVFVPYVTGTRAFRTTNPLPTGSDGMLRLPRVLRETTSFVLYRDNAETEGLFRVNARAISLEILKEAYDRGQKFIIWREGDMVQQFPQHREGFGEVTASDVDEIEGYSASTAAGLIKLWYAELKDPIFPESSYQYLERSFGGTDVSLSHDKILEMIGSDTTWSQISTINRQILRCHLLPLLSEISRHPKNQMTPRALATCFAPNLLCGPDPIRDARMCGIISKIIEYAVTEWKSGLCQACGQEEGDFWQLLEFPASPDDREDPLDHETVTKKMLPADNNYRQSIGITLIEHDSSDSSGDEEYQSFEENELESRPPLPPRGHDDPADSAIAFQEGPPRYSTIITSDRTQVPNNVPHLPQQPINTVHRKPTPAQSRTATNELLSGSTEVVEPEHLPIGSISLHSVGRTEEAPQRFNESNLTLIGPEQSRTGTHGNAEQQAIAPTGLETTPPTVSGISRKPLPEN